MNLLNVTIGRAQGKGRGGERVVVLPRANQKGFNEKSIVTASQPVRELARAVLFATRGPPRVGEKCWMLPPPGRRSN